MTDTTKRLRRLVKKHELSTARLAELAGEGTSIKTVQRWLAPENSTWHTDVPAYRLELIELRLAGRVTP
jgi:hypothetical protein